MSAVQIHDFKYDEEPHQSSDDFDFEPVDFDISCEKKIAKTDHVLEYTLALIKPSALKNCNEIMQKIKENGFGIIRKRQVILSPEEVSEFYKEHYGKPWFPRFVIKMSNKPLLVLCLSKYNAIRDFKTLIGPPRVSEARKLYPLSLRALYGLKGDKSTNAIHGSENSAKAEEELHFFFSRMITKPIRTETLNLNFLKERVNSVILNGLTEVCKVKPPDPVIWFANWLLVNNPNKPKMPTEILQCPYTLDELLPNPSDQ